MQKLIYSFLFLSVSFISSAQITNDSLAKRDAMIEANDTIVPLEEVVVYRHKWSAEEKKEFQLLQNRVYKVYPIAKIAAERLTVMNKSMDKMKTNREKKKYFKNSTVLKVSNLILENRIKVSLINVASS